MAGNETLYATKGYLSVVRSVDPSINIDWYIIQRNTKTGLATTVAGDVMGCYGETQGEVDQMVNTDSDMGVLGVCLGPTVPAANYDLDDAIAADTMINILRPTGGRTIISVVVDSAAVALYEGDFMIVGEAGHVAKWVYNDTDDSTDTLYLVVGQSAQVYAGDASDDRVIDIYY
jgi:hypothetical protein